MKFLEIAAELKKSIEEKVYPPGSALPHTKELVRKFKVSHITIARAVQSLAKQGWVRRVKSKGTFVLETAKDRGTILDRDRRIGLCFPRYLSELLNLHHMRQAYLGMEETFKRAGKSLIVLPMENKKIEDYIQEIDASQLSGLLVYSVYNPGLFNQLLRRKIPMVYVDYIDYGLPVDQVTTDHLKAGVLTVRKFSELGHRKILFFGNYWKNSKRNSPDHEYWWQAMKAEAGKSGLKEIKSFFIPFETLPVMKEKVRKILHEHGDYTAYACASTTYFELLKSVIENEGDFKGERDVVLFSDWREDKFLNGRRIYQCRWDTKAMGTRAADVLLEIRRGGPHKSAIHYLPVEIK